MAPTDDKVRENRARRWAKRLDLELQRSRARLHHINDHGLYRLSTISTNTVFDGVDWELTLEDVEHKLAAYERKLVAARKR